MTFPGSHGAVAAGSLQASMQSVSYQNYSLATIIFFGKVPNRVFRPTTWAIVAEEKEGGCLE